MTFKPAIWRPIAAVLSVVNLVAVGFAAGAAEPWHATLHAGLTLAFAAWAQRLGRSPAQPAQAEPANRLENSRPNWTSFAASWPRRRNGSTSPSGYWPGSRPSADPTPTHHGEAGLTARDSSPPCRSGC